MALFGEPQCSFPNSVFRDIKSHSDHSDNGSVPLAQRLYMGLEIALSRGQIQDRRDTLQGACMRRKRTCTDADGLQEIMQWPPYIIFFIQLNR
jgi:hypothetical protein